jgi:hypothetical protein
VRPGSVLVAVRDYNTLDHLERALSETDTEERDLVVMTVRLMQGPDSGERDLFESTMFTDYEQRLFTRVVGLAEKHGKPVELLVVPSINVFDAVAQTARVLDCSEIIAGESSKLTAAEQSRLLGKAWERLPEKPRRMVHFRIVSKSTGSPSFSMGAHAPDLTEDDVNLIHKIWLQVSQVPSRSRLHHRDVVRVALNRLDKDLTVGTDAFLDFYRLEHNGSNDRSHKETAARR